MCFMLFLVCLDTYSVRNMLFAQTVDGLPEERFCSVLSDNFVTCLGVYILVLQILLWLCTFCKLHFFFLQV